MSGMILRIPSDADQRSEVMTIRLVHNAHRIELQGESMRKKRRGKTNGEPS
jgi:DNA replication protein DnaC